MQQFWIDLITSQAPASSVASRSCLLSSRLSEYLCKIKSSDCLCIVLSQATAKSCIFSFHLWPQLKLPIIASRYTFSFHLWQQQKLRLTESAHSFVVRKLFRQNLEGQGDSAKKTMAEQAEVAMNRQIILKHHVKGMVKESDFELRETKIFLQLDKSRGEDVILVKNIYLSPDPYMRTRMQPMEDPYIQPYTPGQVIDGYGVCKVIASSHPEFKVGDYVTGFTGWEDYSMIKDVSKLRKIPDLGFPLSYFLGVLGMPGQTAYVGFYQVALPRLGDQLLVSGAAGAVGQLVGQFGKLSGCYVVGVAGSQEKVKLLKEQFGFDDAFNYKDEPDLNAAIKRHLPKKIDIYWENVGGKMLEAALSNIKKFARIPVCGMISQYNVEKGEGPSNLFQLVAKSVRMQGFLVFEYEHLYDEFIERVSGFLKQKKIKYLEDITEGLENAPRALIDLFEGKNIGKKIVKICDP